MPGAWNFYRRVTCSILRFQAGAGGHLDDASSGSGSSEIVRRNTEKASIDDVSEPSSESHGSLNVPLKDGNLKGVQSVPKTEPIVPCYNNNFPSLPTDSKLSESSMSIKSWDRNTKNCSPSHYISMSPQKVGCQFSLEVQSGKKTTSEGASGETKFGSTSSVSQHDGFSFDICEERRSSGVKLKTPLHKINKAKRKEELRMQGDNIKVFRPGMILLKGYLSLDDQVTYYVYPIIEVFTLYHFSIIL